VIGGGVAYMKVVVKGLSNREAVATLCLSAKTVENHLGRVYRKLGVRSRTQRAAAFHALPSDDEDAAMGPAAP
jgi:DNA-binding NarL/FixJ family response regulator